MCDSYNADLESSEERLNAWQNGKVSAGERRILFTKWLGEAWEDYTENHADEIFNAFQRCGMCNAIDGSENHRVKVPRVENYQVPAIDAQPVPLPKKRKKEKKERRKKIRKKKNKEERKKEKNKAKTGVCKHHQ